MNDKDIVIRPGSPTRVIFLYPFDKAFIAACKALKARGLLTFGPVTGIQAWYGDLYTLTEEVYARYKMLLAYYPSEVQEKFNALFPKIEPAAVKATIANPAAAQTADAAEVDALIKKYENTRSPLMFKGSRHQAEGVVLLLNSLKKTDGTKGAINADEPRMGKSRTAIVAAVEAGFKNILIVTTKTAKTVVWPDEILAVDQNATIALIDQNDYRTRAQWTIVHWDTLRRCDDRFFDNAKTFDVIILDEVHYAKNATSGRGAATVRLVKEIPYAWLLTGTPVTKRPKNLVALLQLINHQLVSSNARVWRFLTHFCGEKDENGRWDFNRAKNQDELHDLLQDVLIRREKSQTDLPPKVRQIQTIHLSPAQRKAYSSAWEDFLDKGDNREKSQAPGYPFAMVQTMILRHAVAMAKVPAVIDDAEQSILNGEKVVIFTAFDDVWEAYAKHFGAKAVGIRGAVTPGDRAIAVTRFQTDPNIDVFIGNIRAAGEAIPLWMGSSCLFNDITWLPTDQIQAEDRIVGGDKKTCFIKFFLAENTSDQSGFDDFVKHEKDVQRIVNRRTEDNKPTGTNFTGAAAGTPTFRIAGVYDVEMAKITRLLTSSAMNSHDAAFAQSLLTQYEERGRLTPKQFAVIKRTLTKYRENLLGLR